MSHCLVTCYCIFLTSLCCHRSLNLQNRDYFDKLKTLKPIDDDYIDCHYGTERAQTVRERALNLLKNGNIDFKSIKVRNVKSDLRAAGEHLLAMQFMCLDD